MPSVDMTLQHLPEILFRTELYPSMEKHTDMNPFEICSNLDMLFQDLIYETLFGMDFQVQVKSVQHWCPP